MVKNKKIKIDKIKTEEQEQIERFIIILAVILIFILGVYAITRIFVTKEASDNKIDITSGEVNYDKLVVGNVLNQNYEEYYVFIYNGNDNEAIYYSSIIDTYMSEKDSIKVYWIDLDNKLNEKYIVTEGEEINKKPEKLSDLKFGDYTLLKIKNKKIVKYIDNIEDAKKELNK